MKSRTAEKNSESLKQQFSQNPGSFIFSRLADTYRKNGDIDQAVELCKQGLQNHPEYITGRIILGRCYIEQEDYENAIVEFTNVCRIDRHNQVAIKMLADLFVKQEKVLMAGDLYRILVNMDPFDQTFKILSSRFESSGKTDLFDVLGIDDTSSTTEFANVLPVASTDSPSSFSTNEPLAPDMMASSIEGGFTESLPDEPVEDIVDSLASGDNSSYQTQDSSQISGEDIDNRMEALFGEELGKAPDDEVVDAINSMGSQNQTIDETESASEPVSGSDVSSRIDELFDTPADSTNKDSEYISSENENVEVISAPVFESDNTNSVRLDDLPMPAGEDDSSDSIGIEDVRDSIAESLSDGMISESEIDSSDNDLLEGQSELQPDDFPMPAGESDSSDSIGIEDVRESIAESLSGGMISESEIDSSDNDLLEEQSELQPDDFPMPAGESDSSDSIGIEDVRESIAESLSDGMISESEIDSSENDLLEEQSELQPDDFPMPAEEIDSSDSIGIEDVRGSIAESLSGGMISESEIDLSDNAMMEGQSELQSDEFPMPVEESDSSASIGIEDVRDSIAESFSDGMISESEVDSSDNDLLEEQSELQPDDFSMPAEEIDSSDSIGIEDVRDSIADSLSDGIISESEVDSSDNDLLEEQSELQPDDFSMPAEEIDSSDSIGIEDVRDSIGESLSGNMVSESEADSLDNQVLDGQSTISEEFEETLQFDRSAISRLDDEPDYEDLAANSPFMSTQGDGIYDKTGGLASPEDHSTPNREGAGYDNFSSGSTSDVIPQHDDAVSSEDQMLTPEAELDNFDNEDVRDDSMNSISNGQLDHLIDDSISEIQDTQNPMNAQLNNSVAESDNIVMSPLEQMTDKYDEEGESDISIDNNFAVSNTPKDGTDSLVTSDQFAEQFDLMFADETRDPGQSESSKSIELAEPGVLATDQDDIDIIRENETLIDPLPTEDAYEGDIISEDIVPVESDLLPTGDDISDRLEDRLLNSSPNITSENKDTFSIDGRSDDSLIDDSLLVDNELSMPTSSTEDVHNTSELNLDENEVTDDFAAASSHLNIDTVSVQGENEFDSLIDDTAGNGNDADSLEPDLADQNFDDNTNVEFQNESSAESQTDTNFDIVDIELPKTDTDMFDSTETISESIDVLPDVQDASVDNIEINESDVDVDHDELVVSDMDVLVAEPEDEQMTGDDVAGKIQDILDESEMLTPGLPKDSDNNESGMAKDINEQLLSDTVDFTVTPTEDKQNGLFNNLSIAEDVQNNEETILDNRDSEKTSSLPAAKNHAEDDALIMDEATETLVMPHSEQSTINVENENAIDHVDTTGNVSTTNDDGNIGGTAVFDVGAMADESIDDLDIEEADTIANDSSALSGADVEERLEEFFGEDVLSHVKATELIPEEDECEETIIQDFYTVSGENTATASGNEDLQGVDDVEVSQEVEFVDEDDTPVVENESDSGTETQKQHDQTERFSAASLFEDDSASEKDDSMKTDRSAGEREGHKPDPEMEPQIENRDEPYAIPDHVLTPTLADIYFQQGQLQLAHQIYSRLLEKDPYNDRIREKIDEINSVIIKEAQKNDQKPENVTPLQEQKKKRAGRKKSSSSKKEDPRPLAGVRISKKKSTRKKTSRKKT